MKRNWPLALTAAGFFLFIAVGGTDGRSSGMSNVILRILGTTSFVAVLVGLVASMVMRSYSVMLRIFSGAALLAVLGLAFASYCYGIAHRHAAIIAGESQLRSALVEYQSTGAITNRSRGSEVWLSSNVVSIAGTQYQCFLTVRSDRFLNEGTLAMTTNSQFIWQDNKRGPKLIERGYRAQSFPARF